jgi:hypothetical protein
MTGNGNWVLFLAIAAIVDGLLAGASADQSIEQLPARHRIGMRAYHAYTQASHMASGRFWLIPLGLGGPVLRIIAALWASSESLPGDRAFPVYLAAGLAVAHVLSTVKAGRINWALAPWQRVDRKITDERILADVLQRFERWQAVRATLQVLTFAAGVWALSVAGR